MGVEPVITLGREQLEAKVAAHMAFEEAKRRAPWRTYHAHEAGQLQFHQAPHITRALFPGNGFGKTTGMGVEFAWWIYHCHPYQITPKWPIIAIWAAETYKQFEILREQLQAECLGPERTRANPAGWKYNKQDRAYVWPDGSRLFLISGDSSWTHIQGINPDLVGYDEEPPRALNNEMRMRRRGRRKTRFCFAATATQGLTWMYREVYLPWLKWHADRGVTEHDALKVQSHPYSWVWPLGGIQDNPGADAGDVAYYHAQEFSSDAEKMVRLSGGFRDFAGLPVFNFAALEVLKGGLMDGEHGWLVPELKEDGTPIKGRFTWLGEGEREFGRVTVFQHPIANHKYVIGHDSAYGLVKGDFDYAVVVDRHTGEQVAEAQGHWGDVEWVNVLEALHWYYRRAFLCGERQVGLVAMRRLYDERGVGYQYYNRDETDRTRRRSDSLGHHRRAGDLVIRQLRSAIGPRDPHGRLLPSEIVVRSRELHRQLTKYQFKARNKTVDVNEAGDVDVQMGAPTGDHDDGVMGLAYCRMGLLEVEKFKDEEPEYEEGTYGEVFKMNERLFGDRKPKPIDPYNEER